MKPTVSLLTAVAALALCVPARSQDALWQVLPLELGPGEEPAGLVLEQAALGIAHGLVELRVAEGGGRVSLPLPDGRAPVATVVRTGVPREGSLALEAELDGGGSLALVQRGETLQGSLRLGRELWRIEPAGSGLHRLARLDETRFPSCATDASHALADAGDAQPPTAGGWQAVTGYNVDVYVVYTPLARQAQGGTAAIEALVDLAVLETNQAYAQSQVGQRLRLVGVEELTGYTENGNFSTELSRLRSPSDGWFDWIHGRRDQLGADMVAMIVDSTQYCGIGYLMTNVSTGFESNAFSVTSDNCATGYYSFAHELGHNMGSHHDRANASSGAFPYSFGFRTPSGNSRTIMAYAPGTRIQYFSNPNVSFGGEALGIAHPAPDSAENWKSLNGSAWAVSQFRCGVPEAYGTSKAGSLGSLPLLGWSGSPQAGGAGLALELTQGLPNKVGLVFWGTAAGSAPFGGATLWVAPPLKRLAPLLNDGAGAASFPFPMAGHVFGEVLFFQYWGRDKNHPDGTGTALSQGLRLELCL